MRAFLLALTFVLAATTADAGRRHAIVIGANVGGPSHEPLRYTETDAARVAAVLRDVAGFAPGDVVLLTQADAAAVRLALIELNARIREESGPTMLFVYYSGHGDARSLHLYGTQLDLAELRNLVASSPARTRVLIVDSCQSGAITRVKGGTPAPEFDVVFQRSDAEGLAILTSSSASEDAQESDELGASIFTHHLVSALLGAADRDGDGLVTLGEAFRYSAERTLAVSSSTRVGPQHPTYRFDLGGRDDLVLSRPASARNMACSRSTATASGSSAMRGRAGRWWPRWWQTRRARASPFARVAMPSCDGERTTCSRARSTPRTERPFRWPRTSCVGSTTRRRCARAARSASSRSLSWRWEACAHPSSISAMPSEEGSACVSIFPSFPWKAGCIFSRRGTKTTASRSVRTNSPRPRW